MGGSHSLWDVFFSVEGTSVSCMRISISQGAPAFRVGGGGILLANSSINQFPVFLFIVGIIQTERQRESFLTIQQKGKQAVGNMLMGKTKAWGGVGWGEGEGMKRCPLAKLLSSFSKTEGKDEGSWVVSPAKD